MCLHLLFKISDHELDNKCEAFTYDRESKKQFSIKIY